ncbi:MAG: ribosome silencing factor [Chloroflexota bacterium]|nr:ribosome silencing factor [Chloroflexota bacterium]
MAVETRTKTSPEQLARALVDAASDRKASDIVLLDLRGVTVVSDFFVICTGTSDRQVATLVRTLTDKAEEMGIGTKRIEGATDGGWVLIDFEDVIAHVFSPDQRSFYRLDELWKEAQPLLMIQ